MADFVGEIDVDQRGRFPRRIVILLVKRDGEDVSGMAVVYHCFGRGFGRDLRRERWLKREGRYGRRRRPRPARRPLPRREKKELRVLSARVGRACRSSIS